MVRQLVFEIVFKKDGFTKAVEMVSELPMSGVRKQEMLGQLKLAYECKLKECSLIFGDKAVEKIKNRHLKIEEAKEIKPQEKQIQKFNPLLN